MLTSLRAIKKYALCAAMLPATALAGGTVDLSLSNDTARLGFDGARANSAMHISAAWLHDEDKGDMATVGLHVVESKPRNTNLYIGIGGNANVVHLHGIEKETGAIAVGGFFRYEFLHDVSVASYAYYAPRVLSFADTKNMVNADARLQYSVIPSARIYAGYRYVGYRLKEYEKRFKVGDGFHVGLSLDF